MKVSNCSNQTTRSDARCNGKTFTCGNRTARAIIAMTVLAMGFAFVQETQAAGLDVWDENSRFFSYDDEPVYMISSGIVGNREPGYGSTDFNTLVNHGVNLFIGSFMFPNATTAANANNRWNTDPYLYTTAYTGVYPNGSGDCVDNNWGGWDDRCFDNYLGPQAQNCGNAGLFTFSVIFSQCQRRNVWGYSLWNDDNGGPMAADSQYEQVQDFYILPSEGVYLFNPNADPNVTTGGGVGYNSSWSWDYKLQYRQEQLLA